MIKEINKKILPENVQKYLEELNKFKLPVLTIEEEIELAKEIEEEYIKDKKRGDSEAKKKLARANLKLVVEVAEYYAPKTNKLTMLDLIQEGNLGLFRAVEMYDWRSKYRFSTFATLIIRKAIFRAIEDINKKEEI